MQKGDELSGMDEQFRISMTGYQVFRALLARGDAEPMVEDIIRHIVLFGEDRKLLETWLTTAYGERLSTEDRAYILRNRNKFGDWGNLSETFLRKILHTDPETGELAFTKTLEEHDAIVEEYRPLWEAYDQASEQGTDE